MIGRASVCLNMIVKNEAKVIARCLKAVRPLIDHWVIVDTGSTDGTQDVIRESMLGVPGELHERPWRNFGANRSEALELARGKADFTLIVDADEVLDVAADFAPPVLTHDAYQLKTELRELAYYRTELVRSSLPWRWQGVLHEYLECPAPFTQAKLEGIVNHPHTDGCALADPQKYAKDAVLLEEALRVEPNNQRYRIYLAQSYRERGAPRQGARSITCGAPKAAAGRKRSGTRCSRWRSYRSFSNGPEAVRRDGVSRSARIPSEPRRESVRTRPLRTSA